MQTYRSQVDRMQTQATLYDLDLAIMVLESKLEAERQKRLTRAWMVAYPFILALIFGGTVAIAALTN